MSKNQNNGKISIANIISLIGLAGIGVVTFFGMLLHSSDGKPTGAILGAVALVAGLGFLLFMSIKAKGAEDNPDKWKYVEWTCLALYIVVAIIFAPPFQRFFYVVGEKDALQTQARQEVEAIKTMYQEYDRQQKEHLNNAVKQIQNYKDNGQQNLIDDDLAKYVKGAVGDSLAKWETKVSGLVKLQKDNQLADIEKRIEEWNYMQLASIATDLEAKDADAWAAVEEKIKKNEEEHKLIPVIGGGGGQPYKLEGYAKFELGEHPEALFAQQIRNSDGNTVLGWVIYVILNLMVLLNYVVASRADFVGPTNRKTLSGGMDL